MAAMLQLCQEENVSPAPVAASIEDLQQTIYNHPGMCLVARQDERVLGAVLCLGDATRGFEHHVLVPREYRVQGLDKRLIDKAVLKLSAREGRKGRIRAARAEHAEVFWESVLWTSYPDVSDERAVRIRFQ